MKIPLSDYIDVNDENYPYAENSVFGLQKVLLLARQHFLWLAQQIVIPSLEPS